MSLVRATINYDDILKEVKGVELRRLTEKLRSEVEIFYSRGSVADAIASLNQRNDDAKKTREVLKEITLETKSDNDLIELLKHREEVMRAHAILLLHKKVTDPHNNPNELILKLCQNSQALVRTLNTKELEPLLMSLIIFNVVMSVDADFQNKFREAGGLRPLAKLLLIPELMEHPDFVVKLLHVILLVVSADENRDPFRSVNGLLSLLPLLGHTQDGIVVMATEALSSLAELASNQPIIAKSHGTLRTIIKNTKAADFKVKINSLRLLRNLARSSVAREAFGLDDLRNIISLLEPQRIYNVENTAEYNNNRHIQIVVIEFIFEMAAEEKNSRLFGQIGVLKILEGFFSPLKNSGARWIFEVLVRVLKVIDRIIQLPQNRNMYIEAKGIMNIVEICRSPGNFNEEVLIEAASILTTVSTKATMNQQSYGKLGVQLLLMLLKQFPASEYIHVLVSQMISSVATTGLNNELLLKEGCDKILMMFLRESKIDKVLTYSSAGLADFCAMDAQVVKTILQARVVPHLISLLGLGWPSLNSSVARILAAVADLGEQGLVEIVKNGGIVPLVKLLGDKDKLVKEQTLLTFGKILFAVGQQDDEYIGYFFDAQGCQPLLECVMAKDVEVQVPSMSILNHLTQNMENVEILRESGIEEKLRKLERHPNVTKTGSQVASFLRMINKNLKQEKLNQLRENAAKRAALREENKMPVWWLKVSFDHLCKMIPIRETFSFPEMEEMIKTEFGITQWLEISMRNKDTESAKITDQRTLSFAIDCLQKDYEIEFVVKPLKPVVSVAADAKSTAQTSKLDALLQRLTHRQLRILIKDAIDQGIDIAEPIKQYININRKSGKIPDERANGDPYGKGPTARLVDAGQEKRRRVRGQKGAAAVTASPGGGGPPPPPQAPAPPPPPKVVVVAKGIVTKIGPSMSEGFINELKDAVTGHNLTQTQYKDKLQNTQEAVGFDPSNLNHNLVEEEAETGSELWRVDSQAYIDRLLELFLSNYDLMNIIFEVVDSNELDFSEGLKKFSENYKMEKQPFARAMLDCGFTLKSTVYTTKKTSDPIREFTSIICPMELPSYIILKLVRAMLHANGGNRMGGAVTENDFAQTDESGVVKGYWSRGPSAAVPAASTTTTATTTSPSAKTGGVVQGYWDKKKSVPSTPTQTTSEPIVQGYWAKKDKPPIFDNDTPTPPNPSTSSEKLDEPKKEIVQGYWARKKEEENRQIKSIWDDD